MYRAVSVTPADRWSRHVGVKFGHIVMQRIKCLHVVSVDAVKLNAASAGESMMESKQTINELRHLPTGHWGAIVSNVSEKSPVFLSLFCIDPLQHVQDLGAVVRDIVCGN